jgi:integrase
MAIRTFEQCGRKFYEVYVSGETNGGRRFQKKKTKIDTLKKAQETEFEFKRELARLKEQAVPYRWEEWLEACLHRMKGNFQPSTIVNYRTTLDKWITPLWKGRDIHTIKRDDVYRAIFETVDPRLKPASRKCVLKFTKRLFQIALEEGLIERNPCLGIRVRVPEVEQKVLTTAEANLLLQEARRHGQPFYDIWATALMTGMRSGELFALRWTDIDFDARIISVTRQWTSKNGFGPTKSRKTRVVPISDGLLQFLKELKLKRGDAEFVLPHLDEWKNGEQARVIASFCQAIGITPVKFHDLRATFITNLLAQGESLARVMSIVGHTELRTTNGYLRRAGVDVKGGTDKLGYSLPSGSPAQVIGLRRDRAALQPT